MSEERQTPRTADEMWLNVLHSLDALGAIVGDLAKAATAQRASIDAVRSRAKRAQVLVLCVVMLLQFVTIAVLRDGQQQLEDCINPTGECAKRGKEATGQAVQALQCLEVLLHGQRPAICEPERQKLIQAGVVLP